MTQAKTLLLVDGSSYLYRAFHAMPDLRAVPGDPASAPTGAIRGMVNMLQSLRKEVHAEYAACVFDAKGPTFRDALYPDYKANRAPMPDDLRAQIEPIHEVVRLLGWMVLAIEGVEADDVIGTLAVCGAQQGAQVIISSGDKDLSQLVNAQVTVIDTMNGKRRDVAGVTAEFGVPPERMVDFQTLVGDAVDNVPGVEKVGPKTAAKWLAEYGSLDALVARAGEIKGVAGENLRRALDWLPTGRQLVTIKTDCHLWPHVQGLPALDSIAIQPADTAGLRDFYLKFGFKGLARAIRAGGAMDEDTAYVEAVGSARMMASLQYLGLPLPQDRFGGTLRYQTDHDEVGRATSCGPRTSRLMVKVLAQEAIRLGVPLFNHTTAVRILVEDGRAAGILAVRPKQAGPENPLGLVLFQAPVLVLAAGGPGELYRDSVYPNGCFGCLGLALEAGIETVNLTESQFGIGTRREGFPWNLSGTYVQALPHIYSVDAGGIEHAFLTDYYRTTRELASNVFRKGYQWPFHATRMLDFGSSLVDLAIFRETQGGRRVFMDFNRNPAPVPGDAPFSLDRLDDVLESLSALAPDAPERRDEDTRHAPEPHRGPSFGLPLFVADLGSHRGSPWEFGQLF